jgi:hypothetical protein
MRVASCAFVSYTFAPIAPSPEDPLGGHARLRKVWEGCGALGMSTPIFPNRPSEFPELPTAVVPAFEVLAGRGDRDGGSADQAFLFARHDTVGGVVSLAPNRRDDQLETWCHLYEEWKGATQVSDLPRGLLGEHLVLTALLRGENGRAGLDHPEVVEQAIRQALGESGLRLRQSSPYVTRDRILLWEGVDPNGRRVVAALSSEENEQALDALVWWRDEHDLVPMGRYLLNASKLDYELRVYGERKKQLEGNVQEVDEPLEAVLEEHRRLIASHSPRLDSLLEAQSNLILAQEHSAGLISAISRLRELQRTVNIARENLLLATPSPDSDRAPSDSFFSRDQRVADWLSRQIEQDLGYADAVLERAKGAQDLTSLRLSQAADRHARLQSRMTLLQTSLLGALLAALAGIGSLKINFQPRSSLEAPLLATLVTLLLGSPALAAHWHERFQFFDHAAAMLFGAAAAWLAIAASWEEAPVLVIVVVAAAGAGLARLLTYLHDEQRARQWLAHRVRHH